MDDKAQIETITKLMEEMGWGDTLDPEATINPLLTNAQRSKPAEGRRLSSFEQPFTFETQGTHRDPSHVEESSLAQGTTLKGLETLVPGNLPTLRVVEPGEQHSEDRSAHADYVIQDVLGVGGMGVVQCARQHSLQRDVALKRLRAGDTNTERVEALLREAMFTGYLEHPNIIPVHQLGRDSNGLPAIVMKRVEGVSWLHLIRDPNHHAWAHIRLDDDRLGWHLRVFLQVCNAVAFAHSRGVLHYDIKPDNVMIGRFGEVYVLDWGIARRIGEPLREEDGVCGTPRYMAPEMIEPGGTGLGPHTDVYLLGATLHEVLTRKPRHLGKTLVKMFVEVARSRPYTYPPEVPEPLAAICNRACHAHIASRYQTVEELQEEVERFLRSRASIQLAEAATESLRQLESMVTGGGEGQHEGQTLYQVFSECRFGFEQALKGWPYNTLARDGQTQALRLMIRHELDGDNLSAAKTFVALLDPVPEEIAEEIAAMERRFAAIAAERARLEALALDFDTRIGYSARRLLA
ncbi:MAG: serine/threonine-protein kinase, partial [Myxococcota bacterium]